MTRVILIYITIFFIFSCSSQAAIKKEDSALIPPLEKQTLADASLLLDEAKNKHSSRKNLLLTQAAYIFIQNKSYQQAEDALSMVKQNALSDELSAFFYIQQAEVFLYQQKTKQAVDLLNSNLKIESLNNEVKILSGEAKAKSFAQNNQYLESINQLILISPLLDAQKAKRNNEMIWETISLIPIEDINSTLNLGSNNITNNSDLVLWMELAKINKTYQHDIDLQSQKLDELNENYKNHKVLDELPENLKKIKLAIKNRPKKIAIFLPESGPFAKSADAIKRGFLNNYYLALEGNSFTPEIEFYNTSDENLVKVFNSSISTINDTNKEIDANISDKIAQGFLISYQDAINKGADFIVGPIDKTHIDLLQSEKSDDTLTLTLNYSNTPNLNKNIFQFGLAPEDEIEFIAEQARLTGHTNVAILAPTGEWGLRLSQFFKQTWGKKGGNVVAISTYENKEDLNTIIEGMFNIDESKNRFKRLKLFTGEKTQFTPRRRQDIDFIYLVATPEMGRQIIPTFAFHDANNIPVYSNSNIYSGEYNASDKDLNGLMFSDLPSIINGDFSQEPWRNQDTRYNRLIAMGMDAYDLSVRLHILKTSQQNKMYGQTGVLDISETLRVNRKPILARFHDANAKPIPNLFENNPLTVTQ